jgi:hypothetical protein
MVSHGNLFANHAWSGSSEAVAGMRFIHINERLQWWESGSKQTDNGDESRTARTATRAGKTSYERKK